MTAERLGTYTRVTKPSIHPDLFREASKLVCAPIAVSNIDSRVAKLTVPPQTPLTERNKRGSNNLHLVKWPLIFFSKFRKFWQQQLFPNFCNWLQIFMKKNPAPTASILNLLFQSLIFILLFFNHWSQRFVTCKLDPFDLSCSINFRSTYHETTRVSDDDPCLNMTLATTNDR